MGRLLLAAIVLCALLVATLRSEAAAPPPEPDRLGIAAMLLRDGHAERAEAVLLETSATASGDAARWYLLLGVARLRAERFESALDALDAAAAAHVGQRSRADLGLIHLLRAQVAGRLERWPAVLQALDAAAALPGAAPPEKAAVALRARALVALGRASEAYATLRAAEDRLGVDDDLLRQRLGLLGTLGLFQQMREEGEALLSRSREPNDHLMLAEALRQGGALREATELLEAARLRFDAPAPVVALLARVWVDRGHPRVAARLLEQRAGSEPERWLDAAELYRRAGDLSAALRANSAVLDQVAKVRQRVGLLVEAGRLHEVAALVPRAERLGLLEEDAVRYALAWGCFAVGDLRTAERLARGVRGADLFERAVALVAAVLRCRAEPEACP
ncbi:MAG: hypothetical protein H6747_01935 [Deltaproteobacteria bacterium]|nr:hypothetical protein [Deltaproteobacteria bacterium]